MFFLNNYAENEAGGLVPDLFLLFEKALYAIKAEGLQFSCNIFEYISIYMTVLNLAYNESKLYKALDY